MVWTAGEDPRELWARGGDVHGEMTETMEERKRGEARLRNGHSDIGDQTVVGDKDRLREPRRARRMQDHTCPLRLQIR